MGARKINVHNANIIERTDGVKAFLENARKFKALTKDEEYELISRYQQGDKMAGEKVINSNLLFIFSLASKFAKGDNILDLVSEAVIGAKTALDRFDLSLGNRFSSFAVHYMRAEISEYFKGDGRFVGQSANAAKIAGKVARVSEQFFCENGRMASESEIAEILEDKYGIEAEAFDINGSSIVSLESKVDEDGATLAEIGEIAMSTASSNDFEKVVEQEQAKRMVDIFLNTLSIRDAMVIRLAFGLNDDKTTLDDEEIAERLNLTSERVRQIRNNAILALRGRRHRVQRIA